MSSRRTRTASRSAKPLSDASNTRAASRVTAKRGPADGKLVAGKAAHDNLYRELEEQSHNCEREQDAQAQNDRAWLAEGIRAIMRGSTESEPTSDPFAFDEAGTGDVVEEARAELDPADSAQTDNVVDAARAEPAAADNDNEHTDVTGTSETKDDDTQTTRPS